ncbi:DUF188 domain-containing protein [Candidatus Sumerlaeota bacterium]|nr:DUF188 domain-containing protein [Candidatus Sumerlaeota bacterium]
MPTNKEHPYNRKAPRFRLFIDGDSCPVIPEILDVCESEQGEVFLISNFCHEYSRERGMKIITVDNAPEAADLAIVNHAKPGDIVVTQDAGAACMLLGKKAAVISPRGKIYRERDMNHLMEFRHLLKKERRRTQKGPKSKPFSEGDRNRFLKNIRILISQITEEPSHDKGD